jgi:hypothetical protein
MGLGPARMQEGDTIAILLRASVPFILPEQETQFTLAGECYIHRVIKGEIIEDTSIGLKMLLII